MLQKWALLVMVASVGGVTFNGVDIGNPNGQLIDRSFRIVELSKFLKNKAHFNKFCNHLPTLLTKMSRADAEAWMKDFCRKTGEKAACKTYYSQNAHKQKVVDATVAWFKKARKYTAAEDYYINRVMAVRKDRCLSVEEECYVTNGIKQLTTSKQRHTMKLTTELCFQHRKAHPNFAKKSCYGVGKGSPTGDEVFQLLRS
ncbi:unnamed protein product [Bursaphelenchus okinawaensis]|uniref:Uncharacterized protein n=1 Tax=Bursaphelenchus okinawaensis TaxID=465554 RepID=A0A811JUR3_9BILA|nr:unnamed protein product [Bursaphelenchus okinawaensis]CAG9084157.1 unnamed protein product [Bursaphelenchus okinawaensis]